MKYTYKTHLVPPAALPNQVRVLRRPC